LSRTVPRERQLIQQTEIQQLTMHIILAFTNCVAVPGSCIYDIKRLIVVRLGGGVDNMAVAAAISVALPEPPATVDLIQHSY
jgi:hypothetical protein